MSDPTEQKPSRRKRQKPALNMDAELYTVDEAAVLLRTTVKAIYAQVERAQLPGIVRQGTRVLFRRDDLRKHVGLPALKTNAC